MAKLQVIIRQCSDSFIDLSCGSDITLFHRTVVKCCPEVKVMGMCVCAV